MTVVWYGKAVLGALQIALEEVESESALRIAKDAKSLCPAGKTGKLRDSIEAKQSKYRDGGWIVSAGFEKDGNNYASFVEFGAPTYRIKKQPFLRPALNAEKKRFMKRLRAKLK